ncbi:surface-adhesin E family protein [Chromobacterium sp. TRC.1.1.SA]|uniref:Surface-adhesin E family protein n=1 Tax=Chromobacterium indicum TaxID=3110228 RepID=A0ABV0CKP2_9NEIS
MKKTLIAALMLFSGSAFAASWDSHNGTINNGSLLIDADSIAEANGATKVWTIFSPLVDYGRPSAGYAYNMTLRNINCGAKTVSYVKTIYYDADQVPHEAAVSDKSFQDIIPDSENDVLWNYVCKPNTRNDLVTRVTKVPEYLRGQAKLTKQQEQMNAKK